MKSSWPQRFAISLLFLSIMGLSACFPELTWRSIAIDGDTAVIGYSEERAAYIFVRGSDGAWSQQGRLHPDNDIVGSTFGSVVAQSGNTVAIGALYFDEHGNVYDSAVYVFTRDSHGNWSQQVKLQADDGKDDWFGATLALSDDIVVVGSPLSNNNGDDSGAVYVFRRDNHGRWHQEAKLMGAHDDRFGSSMSMFGNMLVIGADMDDVGDEEDAGAVYIFARSPGGRWSQRAKLHPSDGASGDWFGHSVALFGNTLAVGAVNDDDRGVDSGSVYLFARDQSGRWNLEQKLTASDAAIHGGFGKEVALFGDKLVIGTGGKSSTGTAYVFARDSAGQWNEQGKIQVCEGLQKNAADYSVALYGNTVLLRGDGCFAFASTDAKSGKVTYLTRDKDGGTWHETTQPPVEQKDE